MKKSTKGAVAAASAAVLLLGGAGSLAYWNDATTVTGTAINSGTLQLSDCADTSWNLDSGGTGGQTPGTVAYTGQEIVPGDSISTICNMAIAATGKHLTATLSTPQNVALTGDDANPNGTVQPGDTGDTTALKDALVVTTKYNLNGAGDVTSTSFPITSTNDGQHVVATITVTFPFDALNPQNASQVSAATLDNIAVTLKQTNSH